jgi:hypothetical protein
VVGTGSRLRPGLRHDHTFKLSRSIKRGCAIACGGWLPVQSEMDTQAAVPMLPASLKLWRTHWRALGFRFGNQRSSCDPEAAWARQLKRLGLYAEDLSWRDSVKVAQYEVLGNNAKRHVRPVRDDRNVRLLVSHAAQRLPALVDRPIRIRDGSLF